jgi:uncharacterized glyoxalase superfamily protein PhnB
MSNTSKSRPTTPPGWHTITPRIVVRDVPDFLEFLEHVFAARIERSGGAPPVAWIGDSAIMVSDTADRRPKGAFLYVYVDDVDATCQRAIVRGVRTVEEPFDTPYGDRRCMLEDRWDNVWQIARYRADPGPRDG